MRAARLGRLAQLDPREQWPDEARDFVPCMATDEGLTLLGEAIGLDLTLEATEVAVGGLSADIVCRCAALGGGRVVVECQLERSDHGHLGQLLTYAAGLEAAAVVWVTPRLSTEHLQALTWLTEQMAGALHCFGVELELWRIGRSTAAPKLRRVEAGAAAPVPPRPRPRRMLSAPTRGEEPDQLRYWTAFREHATTAGTTLALGRPWRANRLHVRLPSAGATLAAVASRRGGSGLPPYRHLRVELRLDGPFAAWRFGHLREHATMLRRQLGDSLCWHSAEDAELRRVYVSRPADILDESTWPWQFDWLLDQLAAFDRTFRPLIESLGRPRAEAAF